MKKRLILLFIITLISSIPLFSQDLHKSMTTAYANIGAYSTQHADVFSPIANQAALAQLKNTAFGMYGEKKFMLNELSQYTAVVGIKTGSGNFALKGDYDGSAHYNETQLGLAYARKLGDKIDLGAQFNYNGIRVAGYGHTAAISVEIGTIFHLTNKLHAGLHINNPAGGRYGKDGAEKLPSIYTFGMGYEISDKFFISTEIIKEEDQPVNINTGIQYKILSQLFARMGICTATSTGWMGFGFSWKLFRLDITSAYHPQLGMTPGLLLLFDFKSKEN